MNGSANLSPRIAVVLVTYNSAAVLAGCLLAMTAGAVGVELVSVVVVDNASTDLSVQIAEQWDGLPIQTVRLTDNLGYAAGINAGVEALAGQAFDSVLVLNPDCRLRPGALAILAAAMNVPGRGVVAPRLVNPDGSLQPTLRRASTITGALAEAVLGGRIADRLGVGELIFSERPHRHPGPAVWATGAALLIARRTVAEVGPWDESFLLYSEETEFLLRAADRGLPLWYEPAAVIEHIGGASAVNPQLAAMTIVNKVELYRRRHGALAGAVFRVAVLIGVGLRSVAGSRTARESTRALLRPSRRISSLAQLS